MSHTYGGVILRPVMPLCATRCHVLAMPSCRVGASDALGKYLGKKGHQQRSSRWVSPKDGNGLLLLTSADMTVLCAAFWPWSLRSLKNHVNWPFPPRPVAHNHSSFLGSRSLTHSVTFHSSLLLDMRRSGPNGLSGAGTCGVCCRDRTYQHNFLHPYFLFLCWSKLQAKKGPVGLQTHTVLNASGQCHRTA